MTTGCVLIVFAKAPVAGYAKTRLAHALGDEAAARLAARMLRETVRQAVAADVGPVELCCAPDDAHPAFRQAAAGHPVRWSAQGDGDLGRRMRRALARALGDHPRALLVGTDAPALDAGRLRCAAEALHDHPVVLNPVRDGGYVLVGLSRSMPVPQDALLDALFKDIAWSTTEVMRQTRERLRRLGVQAAELPVLADVDEPDDLRHLPEGWLE